MTSGSSVTVTLPARPYRGIEPFRYIDHPIFFAREDEKLKLQRLITVYRCVLLYGESGSGKSSLINAALIPATREFAPERLRVQPVGGAEVIVERIPVQDETGPPYLPSYFASPNDEAARVVLSAKMFRDRLMLFQAEDVVDAESLANRLQTDSDPVSAFLRSGLRPGTQQLLQQFDDSAFVSTELFEALLTDLNHQLATRTDLYDEKRFAGVSLSAETRQLVAQQAHGPSQLLSNRLLFQEVYRQEIQLQPRPLLILDQFEEIVTLFEEAARDREELVSLSKAQGSLLEVLATLLQDPVLPVKLLFAFREDYLAKIRKRFAPLYNLPEQFFYLMPPGVSALHKIIRGPFEKFPGVFPKELSESLAQKLAAEMRGRSETGYINLSEVQIVCSQLWQAEDPEALFQEKGVQGLLEDYFFETLRNLPEDLRDPALALLSRMVTRSGARNPISEEDLLDTQEYGDAYSLERLRAALLTLHNQTRLVTRESSRDMPVYEIASEYLSPWILNHRIESEKRIAEHQAREERRKKRRAMMLAAAIFVVALLLGLFASRIISRLWTERNQAQTEAQDAKKNADKEIEKIQLQIKEKETERNTLIEQVGPLKQALETMKTEVAPLKEQKETLLKQKEELLKQYAPLQEKIVTLRAELAPLEREKRRLEEVNSQLGGKVTAYEAAQPAITPSESPTPDVPWKGTVGRSFTPDEFEAYVKSLRFNNWRPQLTVLHHTVSPTLGQSPNGITDGFLKSLEGIFRNRGLSAGPHLLVDDKSIWVFTPLTVSGIHSPEWNKNSWGIMILGNYDEEVLTEGRGAKVRENAVAAIATLDAAVGLSPIALKFHREDPRSFGRSCPGKNVDKGDIIRRVRELMARRSAGGR